MADEFGQALDRLVTDLTAASRSQRLEAAKAKAAAAIVDKALPWAFQVTGTLEAQAAALGWPTSGTFRAWEGNGFKPATVKPFDVWTQPCRCCGQDLLILSPKEGRPSERERTCTDCKVEKQRARWAVQKRRQRAVTAPAAISCAHCGTTFTPKRSTAQFCGTACRVAAHRAKAKNCS